MWTEFRVADGYKISKPRLAVVQDCLITLLLVHSQSLTMTYPRENTKKFMSLVRMGESTPPSLRSFWRRRGRCVSGKIPVEREACESFPSYYQRLYLFAGTREVSAAKTEL